MIDLQITDYKGRVFTERATIERDPATGPGWYIFARAVPGKGRDCYGGHVCKLVARPAVPERAHPHYNGKVARGWRTRAEAAAVLAALVAAGQLQERAR